MEGLRRWAWLAFAPALAWAQAGDDGQAESFDVPFDQLLDAPVFSVSRHLQSASEAPASVSVVTAADIRAFGHRTLADVLGSVRGFAVTYDRLYQRAGVRGFAPPSDFNTRILILIDGVRANDAVYDHGFIGQDFPVDIGLIDRVEIVRGPGSSLYGGNAMLATVNVITKHGMAAEGLRAALEAGSGRAAKGRLSWGRRLEGNGEALLSLTASDSRGRDLWVADANTQPPLASTTDSERNRQLLARLSLGPWRAEWIHARRTKGMSTGVYDLTVGDPFNREYNRHDAVSLSHTALLGDGGEVVSRVHAAQYGYWEDTYATAYPDNPDYERVDGRWWGAESRWRQPLGDAHALTAGIELQRAASVRLRNYFTAPAATVLDAADRSTRLGLYVQDEWRLAPAWALHGGLRYDRISGFAGHFSPRLAVVWEAAPQSVWKLAYNEAFRAPNAFERLYRWCDPFVAAPCDHTQVANPALRPEHVSALELMWQWQPVRLFQFHASLYANRIVDVIRSVPVRLSAAEMASQFQNSGTTRLSGVEFEATRRTLAGGLLRGSLAFQGGRESDGRFPVNAPRRVLKLGAAWPLAGEWLLGAEMQALSARETMETGQLPRGRVGGHAVANLNLSWEPARHGLTVSLGVRNLFDRRYADPAHDEYLPLRRDMLQDGRSWRLAIEQRF
jgi:iron complex outermembrane receptor protein